MHGNEVLFLIFSAVTVGSAAIVVFSKKIIYAAFALMLSLFALAGLYVFLSADFIAAVQVIIYVGGILILVLFGVLLTANLRDIDITTLKSQRIMGAVIAGAIFVILSSVIFTVNWSVSHTEVEEFIPQTLEIGELLMTKYLLPFEVASILLLVALIGSMFLIRVGKQVENK